MADNIFLIILSQTPRQLLGSTDGPESELNGTFTFRRRRPESLRSPSITARDEIDGDDEILESLVKATKATPQRPVQRERKRTRNAERKSCKLCPLPPQPTVPKHVTLYGKQNGK